VADKGHFKESHPQYALSPYRNLWNGNGRFGRDAASDAETAAVATDGDEVRAAERVKTRLFRRLLARGYPADMVRDLLDVS